MEEHSISIEDILSDLKPVGESNFDFYKNAQKISNETESLEKTENLGILKMREKWANWILFFIGLVIVFDIILIVFYGLGKFKFDDPKIVMVVITDNFLKIIGLGVLITNNIFKKIYKNIH